MLVLTRKAREAIMLGDDIKITILEIDSERVKIGIDAPQIMKVLRAELIAEIRCVNREATYASSSLNLASTLADPIPARTELDMQTIEK